MIWLEKEHMLYMYVYRMVLSDIYNGKYQFQDKLPTLLELCKIYSVGRNTVRSALIQLQNDGYVIMQKGVQATVCFQLDSFENQRQYKQAIQDSRQMIIDIFETMEYLLPNISVVCLHRMTPEQFFELENKVNQFSIDCIKSEKEMIQELYNIYLYAFSILDNSLLNDLFITFMSSIYQPLVDTEDAHSELKRNIKLIQRTLKFLLKFANRQNDFMVKHIIAIMCKSNAKIALKYIDELCEDMDVQNEKQFVWVGYRNQDYLYVQVVLKILSAIQHQTYVKGISLPSIAKLSKQYDVSEKTVRKALDVLREYCVIETINGVGSIVIVDNHYDKSVLFNSPSFQENMKVFSESLELISLILPIMMMKVLESASYQDLVSIKDKTEADSLLTLEPLYDYVAAHCNPCHKTIFEELKKPMGWNIFVGRVVHYSAYDLKEHHNEYFNAILSRDTYRLCQIVDSIFRSSLKTLQLHMK